MWTCSQFLWVRNLEVVYLGGSDSGLSWYPPRCSYLKAWLGPEVLTPKLFSHMMQAVGRRQRLFQAAWMYSEYDFPHSQWPQRARQMPHLYSLILAVTHGHFCSILFYWLYRLNWASLVDHMVKTPPAMQQTWVQSLGQEDPLEEGMATHSSILAWRIPWTEEPGRLQSMESQRVTHSWATNTFHFHRLYWL